MIVYVRPLPLPLRWASNSRVRSPVIRHSGDVPFGSLLATETIFALATPQLSVAATDTVTGTILLFGGHKTFGVAATLWITGDVSSASTLKLRISRTGFDDVGCGNVLTAYELIPFTVTVNVGQAPTSSVA